MSACDVCLACPRCVCLAVVSHLLAFVDQAQPPTCARVASTMPVVWPTCPACVCPMSLGSDAANLVCPGCGTTLAEGSLTVRWTIPKKLFSSKRTRLTLRTCSPEILFTLLPNVAPSIREGRGGAALLSNCSAAVSVRRLECSAAPPFLHLMSVSVGEGGLRELHHSFDSNRDCVVPLAVDLRAARESEAASLQLTFVIRWAVCL